MMRVAQYLQYIYHQMVQPDYLPTNLYTAEQTSEESRSLVISRDGLSRFHLYRLECAGGLQEIHDSILAGFHALDSERQGKYHLMFTGSHATDRDWQETYHFMFTGSHATDRDRQENFSFHVYRFPCNGP